jgi:hypothetical protein
MTDLSVTLKYNPHHRTNIGPKEMPAVRVYRSDPEGVTLQIRREREYMSAWLSFADALAVADAICEAARKSGATMNRKGEVVASSRRSEFSRW